MIRDAVMIPLRELPQDKIMDIKDKNEIRKSVVADFKDATKRITASVSQKTILEFDMWRKEVGQV